MPLESGVQLGPYKIISLVGAGGMGEVYQSRDTRLERTVAIKVLPGHLSEVAELRERFEREARAVASLNHPHICTLHDVGREQGVDFLVMEYLDGETLASRLEKGPLPLDQALRYAANIADALDKAHREGITHRDLKPSNIMLTRSGPKLLDFGLAKWKHTAQTPTALSALPTNATMTAQGTILGTLQYMAPEQLEGSEADSRTDIFALGVVLYEMVTGKKAFEGKSQASLIGAILKDTPKPISALQPVTPLALDYLVSRCLEKDPERRWQNARDLVIELERIAEEKPAPVVSPTPAMTGAARAASRRGWIVAAFMSVAFLAAIVPAARYLLQPEPESIVRRFTIDPPATMPNPFNVAISPDGRQLAYYAAGPDNSANVIWVRPMDSLAARPLPGTEGANGIFWSPDSRFVLFGATGNLKRIDLLGGLPQTIAEAPNLAGATWNSDDVIVFSTSNVLYQVHASGGTPKQIYRLDPSKQERGHGYPSFLPDNRHFLFTVASTDAAVRGIYLGSLENDSRMRVLEGVSMSHYSPAGYILYHRDTTLMAQPFDASARRIYGDSAPVADQVAFNSNNWRSSFSISSNGVLAYVPGGAASVYQLTWYDRRGRVTGTAGNNDNYRQIRLSPDEKRVVFVRGDTGATDLWILELSSNIPSRFTSSAGSEADPLWSADGSGVAFTMTKDGRQDIYLKAVGANQEELLYSSGDVKFLEDWSRDGKTILFRIGTGAQSSEHALSMDGERKASKVFESPFQKDQVHLSPDGRWVAFNSNDSGRAEVYVASYPSFSNKRQISNAGGGQPVWRKDGRELFYLSADGKLMSVDIQTASGLETGPPKLLFQTKIPVALGLDQYTVTGDGQRFLAIESVGTASARPTPIQIVLDWPALLRTRR